MILTKTKLCFLIVCLSSSICLAQPSLTPPPGLSKEETKQWIKKQKQATKEYRKKLKDLQKENEESNNDPQQRVENLIRRSITQVYDKFKNTTTVSLDLMPVYVPSLYTKLNKEPHLYVYAEYDFKGVNKPTSIIIGFVSKKLQGYWFRDNRDLNFIADDNRINLGNMSHDGNATPTNILGNIFYITNEALSTSISIDDFLQIANAKNVEFRLGNVEGSLSEKHLSAFRDLIADANLSIPH